MIKRHQRNVGSSMSLDRKFSEGCETEKHDLKLKPSCILKRVKGVGT